LEDLKREYESFNYTEVIKLADELLADTSALSENEIIEIFMLKAIAHYSLNEEVQVRTSFIEVLKINNDYEPDPAKISPKIINIFNSVRNDFLLAVKEESSGTKPSPTDTIIVYQKPDTVIVQDYIYKHAMIRSILLPGWGHLYAGDKTKGFILTGLGTAALASMLYFIVDTNNKENEYLNETDPNLLEAKYAEFNDSYKIRNGLIIAYAVIWIYAQLDMLFFNNVISQTLSNSKISYGFNAGLRSDLELSLKYSF
jgi:hypothetical protein